MRAKFVGNGKDDPEALRWLGVVWPLGVAVEVPPHAEARIKRHSHFEVVKGRPPKAKAVADDEDSP